MVTDTRARFCLLTRHRKDLSAGSYCTHYLRKLTLGHVLPEILNRNKKLALLASQNIDGLDHKVISDPQKLYNPHGLMSVLVTEPTGVTDPLCTTVSDPIYQRYTQLVQDNIKDIYADRPKRNGRSGHLWPGPSTSTPITLDMFGDLLPDRFTRAKTMEAKRGTFSVKPGSVNFDSRLWTKNAAGEPCNAFEKLEECDLVLIMGTSLSGLTIDGVAHMAGPAGLPRIVFDRGVAPVDSLRKQGGWDSKRDCHLQGPLDETVLDVLVAMGWLLQAMDFVQHLCLPSLRTLKAYISEQMSVAAAAEHIAKLDMAIQHEVEREKRFYDEE